jgi:hypothetical protein
MVSVLVIVKLMLVGAVVLFFLAATGTIRYRITEAAVEVLILGRVARRVPLTDIEEVHRRGALLHESWSGFKFWNAVTIRRRQGWLRNFVISPEEPDRFAERLRAAVAAAGGPGGGPPPAGPAAD